MRSRASGWPVVTTDSSLVAGTTLGAGRGRADTGPELDVVEIELASDDEPTDPARPEAVMVRPRPSASGPPSGEPCAASSTSSSRATRSVPFSAPWARRSPIWTWTDPVRRSRSSPQTGRRLSPLTWQARGATSTSAAASTVSPSSTNASWRQRTAPGTGCLSADDVVAAIGGTPRYLVVALGAPHRGQSPKLVLGVLPRP